jgi:hypothetical protein
MLYGALYGNFAINKFVALTIWQFFTNGIGFVELGL